MTVEWREVVGWPQYLVSDEGYIYSKRTNKILKLNPVEQVCLGVSGEKRSVSPGVLVLEAFVGSCPVGMECCHYDDDRSNNTISNVRWDVHKANMVDRDRNGNTAHLFGTKNGCAKMTEDQVLEAKLFRKMNSGFWTYKRLGERYGVTYRAVSYAVNGVHWPHLNGQETEIDSNK